MLRSMVLPSGSDVRRSRVVSPVLIVVSLSAVAVRTAAADEPARDLFGLEKPKDEPTTCANAEDLACPANDDPAPAKLETRLAKKKLARLPLAAADLDAAAGLAVGAGRDDAGLHYAGATSVDNRWLVDGAAIDSPRLGSLGVRVPLAFVEEVAIATGGFSVRDRATTGAVIEARLVEGGDARVVHGGVWLGVGAPPRLTAAVPGEYRSFQGRLADQRTLDADVVASGPLGRAGNAELWYAAGIAPRLWDASLVRHAWRRADVDGDMLADEDGAGFIVHESLGTAERGALAWSVPVMARLGARATHHQLAATALVTTSGDTRWATTAEESAAGVDRRELDAVLSATWRGQWTSTRARVLASWMRDQRIESPHAEGGDAPDIGLAYFPAPDAAIGAADNAVREGCQDTTASDPYPGFQNCPFPTGYYHVGGAGQLGDVIQDRPGVLAEIERTFGTHAVALGASGEDARVVLRTRYTGGYLRRQLAEEAFIDYRLVDIGAGAGFDDSCGDGVSCNWLREHERTIRTRGLAAWMADTWRPGARIAVEYGLRAESSQIGESVKVRDLLPRVGASWDVLGAGRSRLFASWGRYAAMLPAGTGERVFSGPTIYQLISFGGTVSHAVASSGEVPIAPELHGVRVDEALAGFEIGAADVVRAGVHVRQRHLGRTLEDVNGTLAVVGAEPGTMAATRDLTEIGASFENSPAAVVHVRFGYAWSRLRGNWPGPYDPVDGFGLYLSSLFDRPPINATGPLPNDQPHRFFAEIVGRGRQLGMDLDFGVRAIATSGRPRSYRTIAGQSFLIPRGAGGRLPSVAQTNARIAARRGKLTFSLDVFNLFNRRGTTAIDEVYVIDDLLPIDGGDESDLVFAKDNVDESAPARLNRRYGAPSRFQAPVLVLLGVRVDL